jgi:hypothetical protein
VIGNGIQEKVLRALVEQHGARMPGGKNRRWPRLGLVDSPGQ